MLDLLISLDRSWAVAINGMTDSPALTAAITALSWAGNGFVAFLLVLPFLRRTGRRRFLRAAAACAVALVLGGLSVNGLKHAVPRQRPAADPVIGAQVTDRAGLKAHSFPSGHSATAFGAATVIAAEAGVPAAIAGFAVAALVGLSRVFVGAHYPSDVIAGALAGLVTALVTVYGARRLGRRTDDDRPAERNGG